MIQSLESGALSVRAKDHDRRIISGNTNFVRSTGRASITGLIGKTDAEIPGITDNIRKENTILKQLEDNKLLLKEAHHRIKNNIASIEALLTMQLDSVGNPEAVSALRDAVGRVGSMQILYENLLIRGDHKDIAVRPYVEGLVNAVISLLTGRLAITVEKHLPRLTIRADSAGTSPLTEYR